MSGDDKPDKTKSLLERGMVSPERTPELFVKPMDRIRRAMALRRAHEETDAMVGDPRERPVDPIKAAYAEAERRRERAEAKAAAQQAKAKRTEP
jgi:acyl-CoA synthetase (NDP forming)